MTINVKFTNREYDFNLSIWQTIRDCVAGEKKIKTRDIPFTRTIDGVTINQNQTPTFIQPIYLPMPNPTDQSNDNRARYFQYIQRASFTGYTARTLKGQMGMVFKSKPRIDMPPAFKYLETNVDGSGIGIQQQSQEVSRDVSSVGRAGLYVDHPSTEGQTSKADQEAGGVNATINFYNAESILDWDCRKIGARTVTSYVKLREEKCDRNEQTLEAEIKFNYRILRLSIDGVYTVEVLDEDGGVVTPEFAPEDGSGNTFDHITFHFVGAVNNRPNIDDAPLQEIADVNIAHYRNSADFEESTFIVGQPTVTVTGISETWAKNVFGGGVGIGSRAILAGPKDSSFGLLQVSANTMPEVGMKHKEEQMIALGARLITTTAQIKTATEANINYEAEASSLSIGIGNVNTAYDAAIMDVALFTFNSEQQAKSAAESAVFLLNSEFLATSLTGEQAVQLQALWLGGSISKSVLDTAFQKGGIIDESVNLEVMNSEIEETPTGGVDLGDGA